MRVTGNTFLYIPETGSATLQFGVEPDGPAVWTLEDGIDGVSLSADGLLSVASTVDVSAKLYREHWVKVVATSGGEVAKLPVVILKQPIMTNVEISADKTELIANSIDVATITATVTGDATVAYVLVNGPPHIEVAVTDGKAVFEVSVAPEDAGIIHVEVAAGDKKSFIVLKAVS